MGNYPTWHRGDHVFYNKNYLVIYLIEYASISDNRICAIPYMTKHKNISPKPLILSYKESCLEFEKITNPTYYSKTRLFKYTKIPNTLYIIIGDCNNNIYYYNSENNYFSFASLKDFLLLKKMKIIYNPDTFVNSKAKQYNNSELASGDGICEQIKAKS